MHALTVPWRGHLSIRQTYRVYGVEWHTANTYLLSEFSAKCNAKGATSGCGPVSVEGDGVLEPATVDEHR